MPLIPELSRDDVAEMLLEQLQSIGLLPDKGKRLALGLGDKDVLWQFPAVIHCTRGAGQALVIPRYGREATPLPPYLLSYIDAAKNQHGPLAVFLGTTTDLSSGYQSACADFGFGLIALSLNDGHLSIALDPSEAENERFESLQSEIVDLAERSCERYIQDVEKDRRKFHRTRRVNELANSPSYDSRFEKELERARLILKHRTATAARALEARDERGLVELLDDIKAGREPL